ncbi:KH domain-containing protein [candidate division KSB1 bacterium]
MSQLRDLVESIVKSLVDSPDEVDIREIEGERTTVYELRVGEGDLGKVIGKHGRTAHSIRVLLGAAATKQGKKVVMEILE